MALTALYIDPDLTGRLRFKQAARTTGMLGNLIAINTLLEGLERLEARKSYDVIYLTSRFTTEIVANFVKAARGTTQGGRAVFMVVLERRECDATTLAGFALAGIDGFLVSPFSTESLSENVDIATRLISIKVRKNEELSVELLVKAVTSNFSNYIKSIQQKSNSFLPRDQLRRTHTLIAALPPDLKASYFEQLTDRFLRAIPGAAPSAKRGGFMPPRVQSRTL